MASKFSFNTLKMLNTAARNSMGQVRFDSWLTIQLPWQTVLIVLPRSNSPWFYCVSKTVEKIPVMPTTSNWSKRTIKLLFYLLSWSLIIQACRVELFFIAIDTSIQNCTTVNIIRIILEVLPCGFSTKMRMFSNFNNTRYYTLEFDLH
mgnify:CR=1 FL=1